MAPIILMAGLLTGIATPTELGAITVVYAIILGFIYRELTWKLLIRAMSETAVTSRRAGLHHGGRGADRLGHRGQQRAGAVRRLVSLSITTEPWAALMMINILLLIVGCFMETTAILLIAVPTLLPLMLQLGIDPVQFGLIIILNLLIGATTPPFGVLLFIVQDIAQVSFGRHGARDAALLRAAADRAAAGHLLAGAFALAAPVREGMMGPTRRPLRRHARVG